MPFSLTLSNTGGAAQPSGYVFYEVVPANTTFASVANATSSCAVGSVAGTLCTLATTSPVPAGGSLVVTYTVTVNASLPAGTTTVANAIYSSPPTGCSGSACPTPVCPDTAAAACVVAPSAPIISFAKSSAATSIAAGASVPYSLTLINTGGAPQPSGFVFYEVVPSNTTFTSVANATSSCAVGSAAGTLCALTTIAPIAAGSSLVVTYTVTVNASIPAGATTIANAIYTTTPSGCTGSACPAPVCPNPAAAACFVVPFGSVIGLAKSSGVTHFAAGVVLPYSLTLSNTGSAAQSSGYVFYEVVPGNTTFTSVANATSSCAVGSAAGTLCALTTTAPIAAGSSLVVTYTVTVNARIPLGTTSAANAIYRTPPSGCVGSTCPVPACPDANAAACNITLSDAVIGFTKSSGLTSIAPGAVVPYSLTLTNSGGMAQPGGFVFYEVVPVNTTFTSVANATSSCSVGAAAGTLCALTTISSLPVGSSMVVTYTVTANASFSAGATSMVNAIYATPPSGCTGSACPAPVCPDAAAVACNITPTSPSTPPIPSRLASMVLTKSASAPTVMQGADRAIPDAGDTITYAFSVTNTGNVAFDSVSVFDAKLPTLNCVAQSAQVLPGATAALLCTNNVYSLTSADAAAGRVLNSATASGVPSTCTPAVVPCPSTLTPPSAIATPLATPIVDSTQMIPTTSTWALLLLSLMLMASAGLVARSKR